MCIRDRNKMAAELCGNLRKLHKQYKEQYREFFEILIQKSSEELKMLAFRLDFNEYYADKYYQEIEFDFESQNYLNLDNPIPSSSEGILFKSESKEERANPVDPYILESRRQIGSKAGGSSTRTMKPTQQPAFNSTKSNPTK
eukprot:TRINITY_DN12569_c0_g1_i2.p1 TRINITY_DN12569_c0_g1~~TRINITY_DN12569_c0_g1_i2.p1  ORF type:complete len:142 (-),score=25.42 TRINITY_DN12569_c0_g1_i2:119-544(-)